jgi:predicted nuclease of predicted toxin-antitoxin system
MRFLLDANLPRRTSAAVASHGHQAIDVRDIGLGGADDAVIAAYAQENSLAIITRDFDFSDIRNYPPQDYDGLAVLDLPNNAIAADVVQLVESFVSRADILSQLPGRLAIVSRGRVRFRPK